MFILFMYKNVQFTGILLYSTHLLRTVVCDYIELLITVFLSYRSVRKSHITVRTEAFNVRKSLNIKAQCEPSG